MCMSNLKQLALAAVGIYPNDYDDYIVPALGKGPAGRAALVDDYMVVYRTCGHGNVTVADGYAYHFIELLDIGPQPDPTTMPMEFEEIAYCPAEVSYPIASGVPGRGGYPGRPGWWGTHASVYRNASYGINHTISSPHHNWWDANNDEFYTRLNEVGHAEKVLMAETKPEGIKGWNGRNKMNVSANGGGPANEWPGAVDVGTRIYTFAGYIAVFEQRHPRGYNVNFVDGHARFINQRGQLPDAWWGAYYGPERDYYWEVRD